MDPETFYSSSVSLVVAIIVATAANGFVQSKRPNEREAEFRDSAMVLAFASISATVSMGVLATGRHSPTTASIVAGGLALAWVFLIASYFELAQKQVRQTRVRRPWTRRVVLAFLVIAMATPILGSSILAIKSVIVAL
ncbi:MAG: hypothetical protein P1U38_13820 [Aeromicrobium sp.]|uniref:hypothetical protein n=1 Tax=Aeromicrobium sp. TaxID=1871063 RepID=UPI00261ADE6A|nr:hypothetical protein [Aeromicrobium sp.]MDF1705843.1 hypothetical protein [Aeromicrobium sp.]